MLSPDTLVLGGRFRIVRPLGAGGMGNVYVAEQVELGRKVAVKVLHPEVGAQANMAERFRREARLLASVDHPSVVRVVEYGQEGPTGFLVMEFAEGETLHTILQFGPVTPRRALGLLVQLAEGLAAIHAVGIVHRDVKPENVVLTAGLGGEVARLLDFGIARAIGTQDSVVSHIGTVLGTPEYLSPEQATGAAVDVRADLYSLGVLAYRTLTGALPFKGPSPRDFLLQHVKERPAPLESVNPALTSSPQLCALVLRLLEKAPASRPESANEVADILRVLGRLGRSPGQMTPVPIPSELPAPSPAAQPAAPHRGGTALFTDALPRGGTQVFAAPVASGATAVFAAGSPEARPEPGSDLPPEAAAPGSQRSKRRILRFAVPIGLALVAAMAWVLLGTSIEDRARALIEKGQLDSALKLLGGIASDEMTPPLHSLRAEALHRKGRHRDEHKGLRALDAARLQALEGNVLEALAEDFGRNENDAALVKLLASFPEAERNARLRRIAEGPPSAAQWGALRYLDEVKRAEAIDLALAYAAALEMKDCTVRVAAAKRLLSLADERTREALARLSNSPKDKGFFAKASCGQHEATAALRAIDARR